MMYQIAARARRALGLALGLLVLPLSSCGGRGAAPAPAAAAPEPAIEYQMRHVARSEGAVIDTDKPEGGGVATDSRAAKVELTFPVFTAASSPEAVTGLNREVQGLLLQPYLEDEIPDSIDALIQSFVDDFVAARAQYPDMPGGWWLERHVKVPCVSPQVVSLGLDESVFAGGAHPNTARRYLNLEPRTARPLGRAELIAPDKEEALHTLAERRFREVRGIPAGQSLQDAGFNFADGRFLLNDNFAFGPAGVTFYFNPYEIAAYVYGPTELTLSYAELAGILRLQPACAGAS